MYKNKYVNKINNTSDKIGQRNWIYVNYKREEIERCYIT